MDKIDFHRKFDLGLVNNLALISLNEWEQIKSDQDILALYCQILNKRMFIIDDKEFLGTKQSLMSKFLSVDQIKFAAFTLNRIAFQVFSTEQSMSHFKENFLHDLKQVLMRLHNREERNKMFSNDFWIIDKKLAAGVENMTFQKLFENVSKTLLQNCP